MCCGCVRGTKKRIHIQAQDAEMAIFSRICESRKVIVIQRLTVE